MTDYPHRWFECPCGREWWTPDAPLGPETLGQIEATNACPLCTTRPMRELLFALEAGSASSSFAEADDTTPTHGEWTYNGYRITIAATR